MKICPYCKQSIEEDYPYCPYCNKPLISNLKKSMLRDINSKFIEEESFSIDTIEGDGYYEDIIIEDDKIEQEIKEINENLESKEILGDPIPGELLLKKSSLYYKKRDLPNALKNLELALRNFEEEDDLFNVAICHNEIGLIQEDTGFFDQAIYHLNRSLEILREVKDNLKVIKVLNNLGNIYLSIKDLEYSYKFYQEALDLSKKENLLYEEVTTSSNIVEVLYLLKDFNRIKKILARNMEFFTQKGDAYGIITTKIKYGKLYYLIGEDYNLANEEFTTVLQLIETVRNNLSLYLKAKLEWECYLYLGKINLLWNNIKASENSLLKSLESVRIFEIGDNIHEGEILENLGDINDLKGETQKSIEYYILSCEIYYKFGDNMKCAQLKVTIAEKYLKIGEEKSKTIKFFEEALSIYEDLLYVKELADIHNKLGDIYLHDEMPKLALEHYEHSRNYYNELQDEENQKKIEAKLNSLIS
ncbi:MAG: tetratricopeptide repeat protein [Promethearchaeota archaeon]